MEKYKEDTDFEQKETWDLNVLNTDKEFKKVYIASKILMVLETKHTLTDRETKLLNKSIKTLDEYL